MWTLHTANPEHWVPLKTVSSFKRMREFQAYGAPWLLEALKQSEEVEVDADGDKIRRKSEVKEPKGQFERSIYAVRFLRWKFSHAKVVVTVVLMSSFYFVSFQSKNLHSCVMLGLDLNHVVGEPCWEKIQKGFGEETPGLQQKLEKFFNQYGRVNAVRMRRIDDTKLFKVRNSLFLFL